MPVSSVDFSRRLSTQQTKHTTETIVSAFRPLDNGQQRQRKLSGTRTAGHHQVVVAVLDAQAGVHHICLDEVRRSALLASIVVHNEVSGVSGRVDLRSLREDPAVRATLCLQARPMLQLSPPIAPRSAAFWQQGRLRRAGAQPRAAGPPRPARLRRSASSARVGSKTRYRHTRSWGYSTAVRR